MEPIAWCNGQLLPAGQAAVPVWDLGVVAGASVSELLRTYRHRALWLDLHLDRLMTAVRELGFPELPPREELEYAVAQVVTHNARRIAPKSDLGVVLFSTAGGNATYLQGRATGSHTIVHTFELPFAQWRTALEEGVRLRIPAVRQIPEDCFPVKHKVRNRLHWWLADQAVQQIEPGSRALLLDHAGHVTETSAACVYAVRDGVIRTPKSGVLDSVTRRIVTSLASALGLTVESCNLTPDDLLSASEIFLSSSPSGLLHVRTVDGRSIGGDWPGPVCELLQDAWNQAVGFDVAMQIRTD
jgi:branched-subunit amino acid aminotransferase/4-amino-4-deoxychorismate lyase